MDTVPVIEFELDDEPEIQDPGGQASPGPAGNTLQPAVIARKKKNITFSEDVPDVPTNSSTRSSRVRMDPSNRSSSGPEWYADLDKQQISMFRKVFELLDADGGGSIDAEELFGVMKDLDTGITLEEIQGTLRELDKDGNGEIDFDEFLYCMTETERYLGGTERPTSQKYSQRQTLFFTAIAKFAIKNSIGEVERYYANKARQAPHVISCYTAGARLIGLNDRQLEQEIRRMRKAAENSTSPYARPLPFVTLKPRKKKKKSVAASDAAGSASTPERQDSPPRTESPVKSQSPAPRDHSDSDSSLSDFEEEFIPTKYLGVARRTAVVVDEELVNILKELAASGSVVAKIPDIHLVPAIRQQLETGNGEPLCSSMRKKKKLHDQGGKKFSDKKKQKKEREKQPSWTIPQIEHCNIPLPVIYVPNRGRTFTIEDVAVFRKKVSHATNKYYSALKQSHVRTACHHWDKLYAGLIRSKTLGTAFSRAYRAYSPITESEVHALSPWYPEPRYTSRQPRVVVESRVPPPRLPGRPRAFHHGAAKATPRPGVRSAPPSRRSPVESSRSPSPVKQLCATPPATMHGYHRSQSAAGTPRGSSTKTSVTALSTGSFSRCQSVAT